MSVKGGFNQHLKRRNISISTNKQNRNLQETRLESDMSRKGDSFR